MSYKDELFEKMLNIFFEHQIKIKMFHFQTKTYGGHLASDKYLEKYIENFDKLFEVIQGVMGKFNFKKIVIDCEIPNDDYIINELEKFSKIFREFDKYFIKYTEIQNIRDEMLGDIDQFKYLLTFK